MKKQSKTEDYRVFNIQTDRLEFSGTIDQCTNFISRYGLGWSFLYIQEPSPVVKKLATVRMLHAQN